MTPSSTSSSRFRQRSSVDFPDPDEPIRQITSCGMDGEVDVLQDHLVAVGLAQPGGLEQRGVASACRAAGHGPTPASSRRRARRVSQSVKRVNGTVRTTKQIAASVSDE